MGLEGQVKLGRRAQLEEIEDLTERQAAYERMVEAAYDRGKGLNAGHVFEVDDVIDPADTRKVDRGGYEGRHATGPRAANARPDHRCLVSGE